MLTLEPPLYQVRGTTIFRDHEDPDLFYALPPLPVLAASPGNPGFTLYKYRRDLTDNPALEPTRAIGAGIAFLETEAPLAHLGLMQAELPTLTGRADARVVPVTFRSGTVRALIARGEGESLVEDVVQAVPAPLVPPHHAAFVLSLSAEGATLLERAAVDGTLPVGVAYELKFLALTPALHARVTMDYERVYDHFAVSGGFTYYVQAKFDLDFQRLAQTDAIKIEITQFTDAEDQQRQHRQVLNLVAARVQADFFRSGIPPTPEPGAGGAVAQMLAGLLGDSGGGITSASALFVLKAKVEVVREQKVFEMVYDGRTAIEMLHVVTGGLASMVGEDSPPLIKEIDLDDPFFSSLSVEIVSAIDFADLPDLREAVLDLALGEHRATHRFAPGENGPHRFAVALTDRAQDEFAYTIAYHFDPDLGGGEPVVRAGPWRSRSRVLVVDPLEHFVHRQLLLQLGPVDPALVARIRVLVRAVDDAGNELARGEAVLDASAPERVWRHHFPPGTRVRLFARSTWTDANGDDHAQDETEARGTSHVVRGPYRGTLAIQVTPVLDLTTLTQAVVEIRHEDGPHVTERTVTFLPATGTAPQSVEIPLLDLARSTYRWRLRAFRTDGTVQETPWAESADRLLVAALPGERTRPVTVHWVGEQGDTFGLRVDIEAAGETFSTFLPTGDAREKQVAVPLDAEGRLRYRYTARLLARDGERVIGSADAETDLLTLHV